jgi:hypothetical protein
MDSPAVPGRVVSSRILDGPVRLWFAVTDADGRIMGAAPMPVPMPWLWRGGQLCLAYTGLRIVMTRPGRYSDGLICAVTEGEQAAPFVPMWQVSLGKPEDMRAGDDVWIGDGVIVIIPEGQTALPAAIRPA